MVAKMGKPKGQKVGFEQLSFCSLVSYRRFYGNSPKSYQHQGVPVHPVVGLKEF